MVTQRLGIRNDCDPDHAWCLLSVGNEYHPATSLLEWMRKENVSTGTKEMCIEGGCGVCLISVSLYDPATSTNKVYTVNSVSSLDTSSSLLRHVEIVNTALATISLSCLATTIDLVYTVISSSAHMMIFTVINLNLTLLTFVYRLYHLGRRGKKETFVCCTSECLGRRDVIQR